MNGKLSVAVGMWFLMDLSQGAQRNRCEDSPSGCRAGWNDGVRTHVCTCSGKTTGKDGNDARSSSGGSSSVEPRKSLAASFTRRGGNALSRALFGTRNERSSSSGHAVAASRAEVEELPPLPDELEADDQAFDDEARFSRLD